MKLPSSPHRKAVAAVALTSALMIGVALAVVSHGRASDVSDDASAGATGASTPGRPHAAPHQRPISDQQRSQVDAAIARLQFMPVVAGSTSPQHPPVGNQARQQPDLYAEAFTKQLLTQDYRSSRTAHVAWVQSESVQSTEPTVVGLTPPTLRTKMAVASVQDAGGWPSPIPSPAAWATLGDRDGYTIVRIQRVFTPPTWTAAVAAGTVKDPGTTAREVDAEISLHTVEGGRPKTSTYSVALVINLEGPPTRDNYGFVTAVTYRVVGGQ